MVGNVTDKSNARSFPKPLHFWGRRSVRWFAGAQARRPRSSVWSTRLGALVTCFCLLVSNANAVTLVNEAGLDRIFSQESFGDTPVDIRLLPVKELVSLRFSSIDTAEEQEALWALKDNAPRLNLFYVDKIELGFGFRAAGTAEFTPTGPLDLQTFQQPGIWGNTITIDRNQRSGDGLARLVAHEIGHTLGLYHVGEREALFGGGFVDNLMFPRAGPSERLFESQVATMLMSPFMQGDATSGFFVEVQQYNVVPAPLDIAAVPLPPSVSFTLMAALCLGWIRRRRCAS